MGAGCQSGSPAVQSGQGHQTFLQPVHQPVMSCRWAGSVSVMVAAMSQVPDDLGVTETRSQIVGSQRTQWWKTSCSHSEFAAPQASPRLVGSSWSAPQLGRTPVPLYPGFSRLFPVFKCYRSQAVKRNFTRGSVLFGSLRSDALR